MEVSKPGNSNFPVQMEHTIHICAESDLVRVQLPKPNQS